MMPKKLDTLARASLGAYPSSAVGISVQGLCPDCVPLS